MNNTTSQDNSQFPEFLLFNEVPWMIVYICEAVLILTGNTVTVYIFWSIRKRLKRTSYLLINLAVADIFVGIGLTLEIGADIAVMLKRHVSFLLSETIILIDLGATVASLVSLVLISLERMFAIVWPFRHRLLKRRYFYVSIGCIWLLAALNVVSNLRLDSDPTNDNAYSTFSAATLIASVLVITGAYLAIWISVRRNQIPNNDGRSTRKNRQLAKTLFIVTVLSIVTCLPYGIMIAYTDFSEDLFAFKVQITIVAQCANSFLNPVVYCFRMPEFKASLKKLLCSCPRNRPSLVQNSQWSRSTSAVTLRSIRSVETL